MFYQLNPEVAGSLGENTLFEGDPPRIIHLHYRFDGWLGDELLEGYPCFIVTTAMAKRLSSLASIPTGMDLQPVEVSTSAAFKAIYKKRKLPPFRWLLVTGTAGVDDFGLNDLDHLVVSERILKTLKEGQFEHGQVERHGANNRL